MLREWTARTFRVRTARTVTRTFAASALAATAILASGGQVHATHSWNGYHWARTSTPFPLALGDNVSGSWDTVLATTASDWSKSTVLDTKLAAGQANPKNCRPTAGRVEVCDSTYGQNGWLGVAQIWVSGKHITQGTVKLNDTYFNTPTYNTTAWRNLVSCQEVGHTLGLDHQDENFDNANLGTCMDYTRDPSTNQHPNQHDYDELVTIYAHLDGTTTVGTAALAGQGKPADGGDGGTNPGEWGRAVAFTTDGRGRVFVRELGAGRVLVTFVTWTP